MMKHLVVVIILLFIAPFSCFGGETLVSVKKNGMIRCGVDGQMPGISLKDDKGNFSGMDVDYCRAVAAAVLGDPEKCKFIPLSARARFVSLLSKEIDILARRTTWTVSREAALNVRFIGPYFITGLAFMVRSENASDGLSGLNNAKIAMVRNTTHESNINDVIERTGVALNPVFFDDEVLAFQAFAAGECQGMAGDQVILTIARAKVPDGLERYAVLPDLYSKEVLSPVARQDDSQWLTMLRAVFNLLVEAEEYGLTQAMAQNKVALTGRCRQLLFRTEALTETLGFKAGWGMRTIAATGNYGEIFDRNLGKDSPFKIERRYSKLWNNGGLLYAVPF